MKNSLAWHGIAILQVSPLAICKYYIENWDIFTYDTHGLGSPSFTWACMFTQIEVLILYSKHNQEILFEYRFFHLENRIFVFVLQLIVRFA